MIRDNEEINLFDVERILGDLPLDIIKEDILTQVESPTIYQKDYVTEVYETFDQARNELDHIEEFKTELDELEDTFSVFLLQSIDSVFQLGVDFEVLDSNALKELAKNAYDFFILNYKSNIVRFLINYIQFNKNSIAEQFDDQYRRRDVTTMNMKKLTRNREDVLILANLPVVVSEILSGSYEPSEFVELASEPEEVVADYIQTAVDEFRFAGNFVFPMLSLVRSSDDDAFDEIVSDIRMDLKDRITDEDLNPDYFEDDDI